MHNRFENTLLNLVAGISPWLAPLIPTYFAAYNAYTYLTKGHDWWDWMAVVVVALVVECIGLAGVHTAIQFWAWNQTKLKTDDGAPLTLAIAAVVFYVVIIILVNAILDFTQVADPAALPYVKILAVALLSLLALNSALIVALRAGQSERERRANERKLERKEERTFAKLNTNQPEPEAKRSRSFASLDEQDKVFVLQTNSKTAATKYGVTPRAVQKWRKSIQETKGGK